MKTKIFILAILTVALGAMNVYAQSETDKNDKLYTPDGLFNHLSIGISTGLSGSGIDVTMPVHRLITVRTGYSGLHFGDIKFKSINTAEDLESYALVEDDAVRRAKMADKIELAAKPNFWNVFLLAEIHPFTNESFHFTAGLYFGSKNFVHFRNTNEGALDFLYDANNKVMDYNRAFNTNFSPIGLKFGDYIFTAVSASTSHSSTASASPSTSASSFGVLPNLFSTTARKSNRQAVRQASPKFSRGSRPGPACR